MRSLANIADAIDQKEQAEKYSYRSGELGALLEECWNAEASLYHNRDRDSHDSSVGKILGEYTGSGKFQVKKSFKIPIRLVVQITLKEDITRRIDVQIRGSNQGGQLSERLERMSFQWGEGRASASSQHVFNRVDEIEIVGLEKTDQVIVKSLDLTGEDITLFLPLWAETPGSRRVQGILDRVLLAPERFWHPFGIPSWTVVSENSPSEKTKKTQGGSPVQVVQIPWNTLIGEALMGYDLRVQAAELITHIMSAIINALKKQHAFARGYDSQTGKTVGERNALQGLAPLDLFLATLGVQIESDKRVILTGINPFPWPVTVKYRGLSVSRDMKQTTVTFPNGQIQTFIDPTDSLVTVE